VSTIRADKTGANKIQSVIRIPGSTGWFVVVALWEYERWRKAEILASLGKGKILKKGKGKGKGKGKAKGKGIKGKGKRKK
jgi:hypothetical protein